MLNKIQSELKAPKNQFNSFGKYKYRNCEDILEAAKPILLKHNATLTITDEVVCIGTRFYVKATATLTCDNQTYVVSALAREEESKKGMDGSQVTGASSSYARKYALNGLFLIDDTKDADSDTPSVTKKETLTNERFNSALGALKAGKTTIESIESFQLTQQQKEQLQLIKNSKI